MVLPGHRGTNYASHYVPRVYSAPDLQYHSRDQYRTSCLSVPDLAVPFPTSVLDVAAYAPLVLGSRSARAGRYCTWIRCPVEVSRVLTASRQSWYHKIGRVRNPVTTISAVPAYRLRCTDSGR
eukprot:1385445-Rhodomonas_salina.2